MQVTCDANVAEIDRRKKETVFISYLSRPDFKLLSRLLQHFGHVQSKNIDDRFLESHMALLVSKGLKLVDKNSNF